MVLEGLSVEEGSWGARRPEVEEWLELIHLT